HQRAAIHGYERPICESPTKMNRPRDQLLPSTALARDQNRRARVLQARNHSQNILYLWRRSHDAVEPALGLNTFAQELVLFDQFDLVGHAPQEKAEFFDW